MTMFERSLWVLSALSFVSIARAQEAPAPSISQEVPAVASVEVAPVEAAQQEPAPPAAGTEPAPDADAASSADTGELSAEELAAMGFGTAPEGGAPLVDTSLKISGFIDVTYSAQAAPENSFWRGLGNRHGSFWVGNVNLYISKNLTESVRTMFEVRFTYLPNGTPNLGAAGGTFNTNAADYNEAGRTQRWGGIIMQRAYLEWSAHSAATLRVGQYLTPYGIWNVDHGSPTIISIMRPFIIGAQMFPERQTGMQLFGRISVSADNAFDYALTVSNGFGPISEYRDLDKNLALGGRVAWLYEGFGQLSLGGSWLIAKDSSAIESLTLLSDGHIGYNETVTQQSDVLSLAADLRWKYEGLIIQGEMITQQRNFTNSGRLGGLSPIAGNQWIAPKDATSWGWYALAGYRTPWLGTMPYVIFTQNRIYDLALLGDAPAYAVLVGLNIRPIDAVALKLEYGNVGIGGEHAPTDDLLHVFQAQLAWAF